MNIVTYHSVIAKPEWSWVAYIVLPNGEYFGVMFRDYTEAGVKAKAEQFWETESKKRYVANISEVKTVNPNPPDGFGVLADFYENGKASQRGHHFAGKVWMRHKDTRELIRVPAEELQKMLDSGYEKSGPRSK